MIQPDVEANRAALAILVEESIISRSQLERAEARLPTDTVFATPAAALQWIMTASERVLLPHEVRIIRESAARDAMSTSAASRVAIVAQAEASLAAAGHRPARRDSPDEVSGSLSPGSVFGCLASATIVGAYAWHLFSAASPPACDDPDVIKTFSLAMFQAQIEAPSPYRMSKPDPEADKFSPKLVHPREVGYAKAAKSRGCFASVKVDAVELPVAYVLRPNDDKGGYVVAGASREIVQARFTHIDADGNFSNTAAPVGRAALEQAIRAGVDKYNLDANAGAGNAKFRMMQQLQRDRQPRSGRTDPEREREIADLEPNGPCRELVAATRYSCNVMLERNDRLAAAFGSAGTAAASADFTIERAAAGAPWRVSDDFAGQYIEAIRRSRQVAIDGISAAGDASAGKQK